MFSIPARTIPNVTMIPIPNGHGISFEDDIDLSERYGEACDGVFRLLHPVVDDEGPWDDRIRHTSDEARRLVNAVMRAFLVGWPELNFTPDHLDRLLAYFLSRDKIIIEETAMPEPVSDDLDDPVEAGVIPMRGSSSTLRDVRSPNRRNPA